MGISKSIDMHCHIMPGVDDGSPDLSTSIEMLKIAQREGIEQIILTPHFKPMHHNVRPQKNHLYTQKLQQKALESGINIKLYSGNEIYYCGETQEQLINGEICTLAGSNYVLVEFHPTDIYSNIHNAMYQIISAGYTPVLAHVERYSDIVSHPKYVEELISLGCYIQENASSIMGKYGFGIKHFTRKMLKEHRVHFVATDSHDKSSRAPLLSECRELVAKKYGEGYADTIFYRNQLAVINDEII
ncbi:MAG: protein-tyrosine-phosphatase [Butyrivibrio sp.]|nr:protein-tyrosine-phosphatase [Butyrivibrio sp.]